MNTNDLLSELNISPEELEEYHRLLGMQLSFEQEDIPEEVVKKIIELHSNETTRNRIFIKCMQVKANRLGAYLDRGFYKLFGTVKWFKNHVTGGDYGFIEINGLGDIFFHLKNLHLCTGEDMYENRSVLILIEKEQFEVSEKIEASQVFLPEYEKDISFMLFYFKWCLSSIKGKKIQRGRSSKDHTQQFLENIIELQNEVTDKERSILGENILNYIEEARTFKVPRYYSDLMSVLSSTQFSFENQNKVDEVTRSMISSHRYNKAAIIFLINFRKFCALEVPQDLENLIIEKSIQEDLYFWWNEYNFNVPLEYITNVLIQELLTKPDAQSSIVQKLTSEEIKKIVLQECENCRTSREHQFNITRLIKVLRLAENLEVDVDLNLFNGVELFQLWRQKFVKEFPVDAARTYLNYQKSLSRDNNKEDDDYTLGNADFNFLNELNYNQCADLVCSIFHESGSIKSSEEYKDVTFIINKINNEKIQEELIKLVFKHSSTYNKLQLFISDYTDEIDYNEVVIYTGLLNSERQKIFFKKLIKLIREGHLSLDLNDLEKITTIDYQTSEYSKEIDGVGLDYTLYIIIQLLKDLNNKEITKSQTIFEIVANQIKKPDDLLVIEGFFDKCEGRTVLSNDSKKSDLKEPVLEVKKSRAPRFSTYCDGRKAIDKISGTASNCKTSGLEFWWCENSKCYNISRKKHTTKDWQNYNLEDILDTLGITYSPNQYEILLGVINRVNRFLEHLSCRTCKKILKPVGKNNFGFYRVSNFQCPDPNCEEHSNEIYLSHCANGHCSDIIDSRDSKKCKPDGFSENCGWYICNNCYACCSSEKLKGRQHVYKMTGQEYKCHLEGHKDLGILCCNNCGNEMGKNEQYGPLYQHQLKWFIDQRSKNRNIIKSGQRGDGKWWFIWDQGGFTFQEFRKHIDNLYRSGFNIPDYHDLQKTSQLVAEPFRVVKNAIVFNCKSCDNTIKINDINEFDYARQRSITKYHEKIFPLKMVK